MGTHGRGASSGAWHAVSLVPHGVWAIHTLGQELSASVVPIQVQASGWEPTAGFFLLQAQAWEAVPSGIMSSLVSLFQERDKEKLEKGGTSLLSVLKTQGAWYPQGGKPSDGLETGFRRRA